MIVTGTFWSTPTGVPVSIAASTPPTFTGVHLESAKPPWPLLHRYQTDADWDAYAQSYTRVLDRREALIRLELAELTDGYGDVTLMCWCRTPDLCHRRLLGEWLTGRGVGVEVL